MYVIHMILSQYHSNIPDHVILSQYHPNIPDRTILSHYHPNIPDVSSYLKRTGTR